MNFSYLATKTLRHKVAAISLCLCAFVATAHAQTLIKKLKESPIEDVKMVSIDRLGNFYLVAKNEHIKKYDTEGNFMNEFSNPHSYPITLLAPWNPLKVFVYSREHQEILVLDRFLEFQQSISLDPSLAVKPYLVTPSLDNNFWLLDKADFSLKKIDAKATYVMEEVKLKLSPGAKPDFIFLREYQNLLFLVDKNEGIQVVSIHGTPITTMEIKNLEYLGFLGQEIYYKENEKIKFYDLYTEDAHEINIDPTTQTALITDERMVLIKKSTVEVWEYKP